MAAVIVVFLAWFAVLAVIGAVSLALCDRFLAPAWVGRVRARFDRSLDQVLPCAGRLVTTTVVLLAGWSVVIIAGWFLGLWAHRLQGLIDEPAFRWWQRNHLQGRWHDVWWKLTDIGSPPVTQALAVLAAIVFLVLYRKYRLWWAPAVTMLLGYAAEKYSQIILKAVVHRGHPPTFGGTWPSGGMGRLVDVYGLIIFFLITRYWRGSARMWTLGAVVLAVCASVQAYARLNNLEHWTTDVVGGGIYGLLLLAVMVVGYRTLSHERSDGQGAPPAATAQPSLSSAARAPLA
jgi:hypothetical protein